MPAAPASLPLDHVDAWIFDLDNTLYPPEADIFAQIDERMGRFIADLLDCDRVEARRIQKDYFHTHGTTLSGLMTHHKVAPHDFLDFVHDVDLTVLDADPLLVEAIAGLPGRKFIFTNGDAPYAMRVLDRLGLGQSFEAIHDIHACGYAPKPTLSAYHGMIDSFGIDPARSLFVEDMARNLKPANALGMTTVWINNGSERGAHEADPDFIDIEITDLGQWLGSIQRRTS